MPTNRSLALHPFATDTSRARRGHGSRRWMAGLLAVGLLGACASTEGGATNGTGALDPGADWPGAAGPTGPVELGVLARGEDDPDPRIVDVRAAFGSLTQAEAEGLFGAPTDADGRTWVVEGPGEVLDGVAEHLASSPFPSFPHLAIRSGESGTLMVVNQEAYVQGFEVAVEDEAVLADPRIDVLQEGVVLDVTPTLTLNGAAVRLALDLELDEILRPIQQREGPVGVEAATPVTIQMPVVRSRGLSLDRVVRAGDALVLALPGPEQDRLDVVVLVAAEGVLPGDSGGDGGTEVASAD